MKYHSKLAKSLRRKTALRTRTVQGCAVSRWTAALGRPVDIAHLRGDARIQARFACDVERSEFMGVVFTQSKTKAGLNVIRSHRGVLRCQVQPFHELFDATIRG